MTTATAIRDLPLPPAPFRASVMQIEPQWIDYNGHLNMAYYNVMMDRAIDEMWLHLRHRPDLHEGASRLDLHRRMPCALFARNPSRLSRAGDDLPARIGRKTHPHIRGVASRREGWISATSENITLHIDMAARKVAPFPSDIRARITDVVASHAGLPRPGGHRPQGGDALAEVAHDPDSQGCVSAEQASELCRSGWRWSIPERALRPRPDPSGRQSARSGPAD